MAGGWWKLGMLLRVSQSSVQQPIHILSYGKYLLFMEFKINEASNL